MMKSNEAELKQILGELSGFSSLCWTPKPTGEFDSTQAVTAVQVAYEKILAFTEEKDRLLGEANIKVEELQKANFMCRREERAESQEEIFRLKELQGKLVSALKRGANYICFLTKKGPMGEILGEDCFQRELSPKCAPCNCKEALKLAKGDS